MKSIFLLLITSSMLFANEYVTSLGKFQHGVAAVGGSAKPVYYDLDGDGAKDIIAGARDGCLYFYKNINTTLNPVFGDFIKLTKSDGNAIVMGSSSLPEVTDWNGDNLPDLIIGSYKYAVLYTNASPISGITPVFAEAGSIPSLGGLTNIVYGGGDLSITAVSYDGTSSNDLLVGVKGSPQNVYYYKNIGTYASPVLTNMGTVKDIDGTDLTFQFGPSPLYFDWDNDGTNELIVSDMVGITVYYTSNYPPAWVEKDVFETDPGMLYYKLNSCGDINNDGKNDLLLGDFTGGIFWLTNSGSAEASFSTYVPIQAEMTNVVFYSTGCSVNIWDFNGDGLWDVSLRRSNSAGDRFYPNIGVVDIPSFEWFQPRNFSYNAYDRYYTYNGNQFRYYFRNDSLLISTNIGSYSSPFFASSLNVMEGTNTIPYVYNRTGFDVADLNADGRLDLWYSFYGTNYWFENTNDNFSPIYTKRKIAEMDNGDDLILDSSSKNVPTLCDWNSDGMLDVLIASNNGEIHYYQNISNFPPVFVDMGLLEVAGEGVIDIGYNPFGFGVKDIDNNGLQNMLISFSDGTVGMYEAIPEPVLFIIYYLSFIIYCVRKK